MGWQSILKIIGIPSGEAFLLPILVNRKEFENTINMLKQTDKAPRKLKATLANMNKYNKTHADLYEKGNRSGFDVDLSLEESKDLFDEMVKLVNEKVKEFSEREYLSIEKIKELLQEAMAAKKEGDKDKVAELVLEITEKSNPKREFWKDYIPERDKLENLRGFLDESRDSAFLSFENPPSTQEKLVEFVKLLNTDPKKPIAELQDGKIYLDLDNRNEYIKLLQPIIKFYNENIRDLKPVFKIGGRIQRIDPKELETRELNIRDAKFELTGAFTEREVFKYLKIVAGLKGSKSLWKPTTNINGTDLNKFSTGDDIPQELFLERGSGGQKSLNLNPYAYILMDNVFSGDWYKQFFDSLRTSAVMTEEEAEGQIIDDIYEALGSENQQSPVYQIPVPPFRNNEKIRNLIIGKKGKNRIKETIRSIISENQGENEIGDDIYRRLKSAQSTQLVFLQKYFTGKEASQVKALLLKIDEDLETEMFNSQGILTTDSQSAMYYRFELFGELITPSNLNEYIEDKISSSSSTGGLEKTLEQLKQRLKEINSKKQTEVSPTNWKKQASKLQKDIESTETQIKRITTKGSLSISELREGLINPQGFVDYVTSIATSSSINDLISQGATSAAYLEQINPKNSLVFLVVMAERAAGDEVGEAFNKIDPDPASAASQNILEALNDNMPTLLGNMKKEIIDAFKRRLQFFIDNYGQRFNKNQASPAIESFIRANMIREV